MDADPWTQRPTIQLVGVDDADGGRLIVTEVVHAISCNANLLSTALTQTPVLY